MNKAVGGDLSIKREDALEDIFYINDKNKSPSLRFRHKNTMYYATRDDLWIFRLNENDNTVYCHNYLSGIIFPRKLPTLTEYTFIDGK